MMYLMSAMLMRQAADAATAACRRITADSELLTCATGHVGGAHRARGRLHRHAHLERGHTRRLVVTTSGSVDCLPHEFDNKTMLLAWVFRPARSRFVK
jgi:hypothetical protein